MQVKDEKVDAMIAKLLEVHGKKPGKNVTLNEEDIMNLCRKAREVLISQPNLLELEAPIKICGKSFKFLTTVSDQIAFTTENGNQNLFQAHDILRRV